jgi:hypothetical protein
MATRRAISTDCPQLIKQDLARSGLAWATVAPHVLAYNPHPAPPLLAKALPQLKTQDADAVLLFQYSAFGSDGALLLLPPEQYARARVYWKPPTGFAARQAKDTRPKYLQRPGTAVRVYPAPTMDWAAYFADAERALFITEGEKKALALAQRGVYAIALGGVYSTAPGKHGGADAEAPLCPDLARAAQGRLVYVAFDIDKGHTNYSPDVNRAALVLAAKLANVGAEVRVVVHQRPPGMGLDTKWAVDDWLQCLPPDFTGPQLGQLCMDESAPHATARTLLGLDAEHVYIEELHVVAKRTTRHLSPREAFRTMYNTDHCTVARPSVNQRTGLPMVRLEVRPRADAWLEWPARSTVRKADYCPGVADVITTENAFNTWPGWACAPHSAPTLGDIKPFTDALAWLHELDDCPFMLLWYLYPFAYPEANKQFVIPVLQSEAEGVGKSIIPTLLGEHVYGRGYSILNADSLHSTRLEFAKESMFLLLDDMKSLAPYQAQLNSLATAKTIRVDEKYVRSYNVRNTLNLIITTNYTQPMRVTADTRRYFFPHITGDKNKKLWTALVHWFEHEDGGPKLLGWAQAMRGNGGFAEYDPMGEAPHTSKRDEMQELNLSDADQWVRDALVQGAQRDVLLLDELHAEFTRLLPDLPPQEATKTVLSKALHTTGRAMGLEKRVLTYPGPPRTTKTAYAVRRGRYWLGQTSDEWRKCIDSKGAFRGQSRKKY